MTIAQQKVLGEVTAKLEAIEQDLLKAFEGERYRVKRVTNSIQDALAAIKKEWDDHDAADLQMP
jgi:predicted nucleic acid-binding protein